MKTVIKQKIILILRDIIIAPIPSYIVKVRQQAFSVLQGLFQNADNYSKGKIIDALGYIARNVDALGPFANNKIKPDTRQQAVSILQGLLQTADDEFKEAITNALGIVAECTDNADPDSRVFSL